MFIGGLNWETTEGMFYAMAMPDGLLSEALCSHVFWLSMALT
jgi:hypothetical protein